MSEPEKTKIQVRKPAGYLEVPIEAQPNGSGTGHQGSPFYSQEEFPKAKVLATEVRLGLRPADAIQDPSGNLIEAIRTVFRVGTTRIAALEQEAQRLREAMAPFANYARQSATPQAQSDGATVEALLRIADELNKGEQ